MKNKNSNKPDIDSIDILNVFRKGKLIIALSIVATLTVTFFATILFVKPVYEATTKILVREEKLNPKDDFPSYEAGFQFAFSQAEIMKSRPIINNALKKIDLTEERFAGVDSNSLKMSELQESIELRLINSTNVLELRVEQRHPLFASKLANAIGEVYIEDRTNAKSKTVQRTIASLEKEIDEAKIDFITVEDELNKIADQENMIMLSGSDIVLDLQKYANVDMHLTSVNADIEMLDTKIALMKDWVAKDDAENLDFKFLAVSNIMQNLKAQISLAELKRDVLMGEFSVNHPDVQAAQAAIYKLKMDFSRERTNIIKAEVRSLETEKKSLIGKKGAFLKTHEIQGNRLNKMIQNQPKLARLNHDVLRIQVYYFSAAFSL